MLRRKNFAISPVVFPINDRRIDFAAIESIQQISGIIEPALYVSRDDIALPTRAALRGGTECAYSQDTSSPIPHPPMTTVVRFLPLAGILSVLVVGVLCRALLQRTRYGNWGIVRAGLGEPAQAVRAVGFGIVFTLLGIQGFVRVARPVPVGTDTWLPPRATLVLAIAGTIILLGGLLLFVTAQWQMGASWRIGIDENAKPGLVESGLFRFTRNPIYLALLVIVTGYVALLPTLWSLLLLCAAYLLVRLQISAEESYLRLSYGEAYETYTRRVSRLLPCLGGA
jgi:protein-S-isoprenylcysteine O-methyltransferase Ste14